MIVVATDDFELYHGLVTELRDRGARFTTIKPGDPLPEETTTVITGASDVVEVDAGTQLVTGDPGDPRAAVDSALSGARGGGARRVVGIDPGTRPGIAVLDGDDVVAVFQVPLADAAEVVQREIAEAVNPVVRVGDGARLIDAIDDARVELVDETGSTPHLGSGARGMGDVLAAVNIARREGEPVERRAIEPTPGELQVIKTTARERSAENRSIPAHLARRVAKGELTVEEALEEHRTR